MGASFSCHPLRVYVCGFGCAVQLFATLWTAAGQDPQSVEFSRQEYWSGLPCSPPRDFPNPGIKPMSPALQVDSSLSEPPGKPKNTGVHSLSLLQGTFPTQELNQGLLHFRQILYQLSYQGSRLICRFYPINMYYITTRICGWLNVKLYLDTELCGGQHT